MTPTPDEPAGDTAAHVAGYVQEYLDLGGDRLGVHIYPEPEGPTAPPVVLIWPAMGVSARFYGPLAGNLRRAGLAVIAIDLRGTGSSTPRASRRSRYGYAELVGDVGTVLAALRPRLSGRRVLLLGHSLGGQACALHLGLATARGDDPGADALVLVAVGLPWYRVYPRPRSGGVLGYTQSVLAITTLLRVWPGWGFGGRQAYGVIRDWAYTARHGRFPRLGTADADSSLAVARTPILAISVEGDRHTPAATMDHLCAKMRRAPVARVHLSEAAAGAALDHFRWVKASSSIAAMVARFAAGLAVATEVSQ